MSLKKSILAVLAATVWISVSEFVRNQFLLNPYWTSHYNSLGLKFPAEPVNGAVWGLWSLLFAVFILFLSRKYSLLYTFLMAWFAGFLLMWVVIGNLGVLPSGILPFAVPLSLLEAFVGAWLVKKISA
jgi:hypothetical protein